MHSTVICYRAFNRTHHKSWATSLDQTFVISFRWHNSLAQRKARELALKGPTTMTAPQLSAVQLRTPAPHRLDQSDLDRSDRCVLERWPPPMGKKSHRKKNCLKMVSQRCICIQFWEHISVNNECHWHDIDCIDDKMLGNSLTYRTHTNTYQLWLTSVYRVR